MKRERKERSKEEWKREKRKQADNEMAIYNIFVLKKFHFPIVF